MPWLMVATVSPIACSRAGSVPPGAGGAAASASATRSSVSPDGWFVRDLQSTHGTLVNGERVAGRRALRAGDVLRCGDTELRVAEADAAVPATPEGSDPARLQAIGETVATISHGIKNILQGLRSGADAVELALRREDLAMAREGWPIVARNLDRVSWLVMNML
ncbi:MAG: FHA domain-containing protein, partial [Phycisphaerales bacterium]